MNAEQKRLGEEVERLGRMAERAISSSVEALCRGDTELAQRVVDDDAKIDDAEIDLERRCLSFLRQDQLPGDDLQMVISVLRMNKDVERVGDLAKSIAHLALVSGGGKELSRAREVEGLAAKVRAKLEDSLTAVRERNVELARRVMAADITAPRRVDRLESRRSTNGSAATPRFDLVTKHLHHVSDLAHNVAQTLVTLVEGQRVSAGSPVGDA
jgi:phosphate transport system protein